MYNETKPGNWYFFSDECNLFFDIMSIYFYILTVFIIVANGILLIQYFFSCGKKADFRQLKLFKWNISTLMGQMLAVFSFFLSFCTLGRYILWIRAILKTVNFWTTTDSSSLLYNVLCWRIFLISIEKSLKSNHQRYKTSVAFADFLIGAFVLPIILVQRYYAAKLQFGSTINSWTVHSEAR